MAYLSPFFMVNALKPFGVRTLNIILFEMVSLISLPMWSPR